MSRSLELYRTMKLIRLTEERILDLFSQGMLFGTTHTCIGQEADAAGVIAHLQDGDTIFSNHRCHGHYLACTGDVYGLIAELMGRETGVCGGISGSQHLCRDGFFSNGIQGGIVPNAVGIALAEKVQGTGKIATVFVGDGTLGEGVSYEAMNIAALWQLPILFVIENNGYAQSTPSSLQIAGIIEERPRAFGIPTASVETTDVGVIDAAAARLVADVRAGAGPRCLVIHTYRLSPHSKGDDNRDPAEIAERWLLDPIALAEKTCDKATVEQIGAECSAIVDYAVARAIADRPAVSFRQGVEAL